MPDAGLGHSTACLQLYPQLTAETKACLLETGEKVLANPKYYARQKLFSDLENASRV